MATVPAPVFTYKHKDVPFKPYVVELFTPAGVNILRDAPEDHKHHHGLMFACRVDGVNFWEEHGEPGREEQRDVSRGRMNRGDGPATEELSGSVRWLAYGTGETLLLETRTISAAPAGESGPNLLTWRAAFSPPPAKAQATLTGTAYHGLGMRFLASMDSGGSFFNSAGQTAVAGTNDANAAWCAYAADADGKPVTAAMFDDPRNPRHPARWFTMDTPFAYLSATLDLNREPFPVAQGAPLVLRYAVAVWDGRVDAAAVEAAYQAWLRNLPV